MYRIISYFPHKIPLIIMFNGEYMKKNSKIAVAGSSAAILGMAGLFSALTTRIMINIAIERDIKINPGIRCKRIISGCRDIGRIENECRGSSDKLLDADCKRVCIRATDGALLVGHLYLCKNAKRTVIAVHGWRTTWAKDFGGACEFFHSNDCNVLYIEQRGQNESGGKYIGFGLIERFDCLEWIKYINGIEKLSRLPIYLCGVSMGATTVLMTAGFKLPKNVRGVIADCGFTSPHAIWKHVINKNLHLPYGRFRAATVKRICRRKLHMSPDGYSTLDAMKVCKTPVLFIHGSGDRFVPIEMTYENYRVCASEKRLFVVPFASHGMSYFDDKVGYEREVLDFFKKHDDF